MTLDAAIDRQVAALVALLGAGVNLDLREELDGARAIESIHPWPIRIEHIPATKLPSLAVYRLSDQRVQVGARTVEQATIRIEYIATATPRDRYADRWPLLRAVWATLVPIALRGSHPKVSSGANLLEAADVLAVQSLSPTVRYELPVDERQVYPGFQGTITLTHRTREEVAELAGVDGLAALVDLDAVYSVEGIDLVEELVEGPDPPT